jgi:hypothetical protein
MTAFQFKPCKDLPSRASVTVDGRFDVAIIHTDDGLTIEVFPITGGEPWDDPFERFEVDEIEIRHLEQEIGHD